MAYCEQCGFRIERGDERCEHCGHLDFSYVSDDARPVDPEDIAWADTEGYVIETTCSWSTAEYIVVPDPEDVDNAFEHGPDWEDPAGVLGVVQRFWRQ